MPELPHVSGVEVQRVLERLGFTKVRQSGIHVVIKRDAKGCVVSLHGEVKVGTLAGLLPQANIDVEAFVQRCGSRRHLMADRSVSRRGIDDRSVRLVVT